MAYIFHCQGCQQIPCPYVPNMNLTKFSPKRPSQWGTLKIHVTSIRTQLPATHWNIAFMLKKPWALSVCLSHRPRQSLSQSVCLECWAVARTQQSISSMPITICTSALWSFGVRIQGDGRFLSFFLQTGSLMA